MNIICNKALFIGWAGIVLESENNLTSPTTSTHLCYSVVITNYHILLGLKKNTTEICYHIILET